MFDDVTGIFCYVKWTSIGIPCSKCSSRLILKMKETCYNGRMTADFAIEQVLQASRKQHMVAVTHLWWRPRSLQLSVSIMVTCTSEAWSAQSNARTKSQGCVIQTWTTKLWGKLEKINWQSLLIPPHTNQNKVNPQRSGKSQILNVKQH